MFLGEIIPLQNVINPNVKYFFKFLIGDLFINNESTVQADLLSWMKNWGSITGVSRNIFSKEMTIEYVPKVTPYIPTVEETAQTLSDGFKAYKMDAQLISVDTNATPGTLQNITTETGSIIGRTTGELITEALKPLIPLIAIGFGGFILLEMARRPRGSK